MNRTLLRLLAGMAMPLALALLAAGLLMQQRGQQTAHAAAVRSLVEHARMTVELLGGRALSGESLGELDALADRAGAAADARVTLLAPDGAVVGDSRVPIERLPQIQNHADRPEVAAALAGRIGESDRRSDTVGRTLLYVAVPVDAGRGGAVRVAIEPPTVGGAPFWQPLAVAGGVGLLVAFVISALLAQRLEEPMLKLQHLAEALAAGDLKHRLARGQSRRLHAIASSIEGLADQLRTRLADTTREKERLQAVLDGMTRPCW